MDKILSDIINFFRTFLRTYHTIIKNPNIFFKDIIENSPQQNISYSNPITFLLISTFLLIFAINIFPLFANIFHLYSKKFSTLILTLLELDARQIIIITLPTSIIIYFYTKVISIFIKRIDFKKSFSKIISYLIASFYLTYFFSFLFLISTSKLYFFLRSNFYVFNINLFNIYIPWIIWILIISISGYCIFNPLIVLFKTIKLKSKKVKLPLLTSFSIILLVLITIFIGIKQKEYDKIFDPLKSYEIEFKFSSPDENSYISFKQISRFDIKGGVSTENVFKKNNSITHKEVLEANVDNRVKNFLIMDMIITNKSPELVILKPQECCYLIINSNDKIKFNDDKRPLIKLPLITNELDFKYISCIDSLGKQHIQDKIMLFPGETQWLHLSGIIDSLTYSKLCNIYLLQNDSNFNNYSFKIELCKQKSESDYSERPINKISTYTKLNINNFIPNLSLASQYQKLIINEAENNK